MEITNVSVKIMNQYDSEQHLRMKGFATITFDGILTIDDIRIIKGRNRLCIMYPKNPYEEPIVVPRVREFSKRIESAILNCYREKAGLPEEKDA